ncbi:MAG: hypothetical protein PGN37_01055 [Mycobacterium kyogaense]|uniref:hypothetical protein n=1 Tax=Mycobacterium kyogaense TaxID=2212479 RepID=UPI002FF60AEB
MARSRPKRKYRRNSDRIIRVRGLRHDPPDTKRLSAALLALAADLAAAQAETDAKADHDTPPQPSDGEPESES